MLSGSRKFISLFVLIVFLIPAVGEELHAFEHSSDFHCHEQSEKHFHITEHHCPICDFVTAISDSPEANDGVHAGLDFIDRKFSIRRFSIVIASGYQYPLRAPPAVF